MEDWAWKCRKKGCRKRPGEEKGCQSFCSFLLDTCTHLEMGIETLELFRRKIWLVTRKVRTWAVESLMSPAKMWWNARTSEGQVICQSFYQNPSGHGSQEFGSSSLWISHSYTLFQLLRVITSYVYYALMMFFIFFWSSVPDFKCFPCVASSVSQCKWEICGRGRKEGIIRRAGPGSDRTSSGSADRKGWRQFGNSGSGNGIKTIFMGLRHALWKALQFMRHGKRISDGKTTFRRHVVISWAMGGPDHRVNKE